MCLRVDSDDVVCQVSICLLGIWSMRMDRRERIESGVGSERRPVSVVVLVSLAAFGWHSLSWQLSA